MLKKLLLAFVATVLFVSCGAKTAEEPKAQVEETLKIGVSPVPHKELVELVKDDLKAQGINLEIVEYDDYVRPNEDLGKGDIDVNFFQHVPYMETFGKEHNLELVSVGKVHVEPIKIYSDKVKDIKEVQDGAEVLIPNDPTNRGRSLILLETAGLIKLKDSTKLDSDVADIAENPKNLKISQLNAEQIAPRLSEVTLAVINVNNALAAKVPAEQAIFVEGKESPYANILTVLKGKEGDERVKKLLAALQSDKVKKYIEEKYNGEVVPAF